MNPRTTLNWGALSTTQLAAIEKLLDEWESSCGEKKVQRNVREICDDLTLLPFVEQRIRELQGATPVLEPAEGPDTWRMPAQIGPIQITDVISKRTLCAVYLGEQIDPRRQVAVKVLNLNAWGSSFERAFRNEIEILARLQHPGIAEVYLAGTSDNTGTPVLYYAMEFLNGPKLTEYAQQKQLTTNQRLELFLQICRAVAHAHNNAVIHRDLKPTNILTHNGQPKILDFGISKMMIDTGTVQTNYGLGTPGYISPEQFNRDAPQDTRSDIFSLGVTLYELLSGELPYARPVKSLVDAAKEISNDNFVMLSQRMKKCPPDLEAVTHKCLQIDPEIRYQSVEGLIDDLKSLLANQEVKARPRNRLEVTRHWILKNPWTSATLFSASICLIFITALSLFYWKNAATNAQRLSNAVEELTNLRESDKIAREKLNSELILRRRSAFNRVLSNADRSWRSNPNIVDGWLREADQAGLSTDCFALRAMHRRTQRFIGSFSAHDGPITQLSVSADGSRICTASEGEVKVWELGGYTQLFSRRTKAFRVRACALHPNGQQLLVVSGNLLTLYDVESGSALASTSTVEQDAWFADFSLDGQFIYISGNSNKIAVLSSDLKSEAQTLTAPFISVKLSRMSPDSSMLLAIGPRNQCVVWDLTTGNIKSRTEGRRREVHSFAATIDLGVTATSNRFNDLRIGSSDSDSEERVLSRGERFDQLHFSNDGKWLLSVGRHRINGRSQANNWRTTWTRIFDEAPTRVCSLPNSDAYLTGLEDGSVTINRFEADPISRILATDLENPRSISLSEDGKNLVVAGTRITIHSTDSTQLIQNIKPFSLCTDTDWNTDILYVATAKQRDLLRFDKFDQGPVIAFTSMYPVKSVATGAGEVYLGFSNGQISRHAPTTFAKQVSWQAHDTPVCELGFDPHTNMIVSGSESGEVALWSDEGTQISRFQLNEGVIDKFAFVQASDRIYCSSRNGTVGVVNTDTMEAMPSLHFGVGRLRSLAASPDGQTLAIASVDNEILICDAVTGEFQTRLSGHEDIVMDLCFSQTGDRLYSVSMDGTLRCWEPGKN